MNPKLNLNELTAVNFRTWDIDNLARLTAELYQDNKRLQEANEQLRLDLKDAMKEARKQLKDIT